MGKPKLTLVKIGGNIIDDSANLHRFLTHFTGLPGLKVLVHGGGKAATDTSVSMGIEPKMVNGRRITDIETLRIVTMVYAGLINKNLVAQLQAKGCNAIGLTGADGNIIRAHKRTEAASKELNAGKVPIDYGYVGDINEDGVSAKAINTFLQAGMVPVLCAITHDGETQLLNTNADTIASAVAIALSEQFDVDLIFCFEKKGVLRQVDDESSVIKIINQTTFEALKNEGVVAAGMLPKLNNAFSAAKAGVSAVYIGHADDLQAIGNAEFGTKITHT